MQHTETDPALTTYRGLSLLSTPALGLALISGLAIVLAELALWHFGLRVGASLHGLLLLILLNCRLGLVRTLEIAGLALALSLLPLLRLLSLVMPVPELPVIYWFVMIGVPMLFATWQVARLVGIKLPLTPSRTHILLQLAIAGSGLPLGVVAYLLLRPDPLLTLVTPSGVAGAAFILFFFSAALEELIFRGVLQKVAIEVLGRAAVPFVALLFAAAHLGSLSWSYVLFMGGVGYYFGRCTYHIGSLWSVICAHGVLTVSLLLLCPLVLG